MHRAVAPALGGAGGELVVVVVVVVLSRCGDGGWYR